MTAARYERRLTVDFKERVSLCLSTIYDRGREIINNWYEMNKWDRAEEKLYLAVITLAGTNLDIRSRVQNAWNDNLGFHLRPKHFADADLCGDYSALEEDIEFLGVGASGLSQLSDRDLKDLSDRIVGLFWQVARRQAGGSRLPQIDRQPS